MKRFIVQWTPKTPEPKSYLVDAADRRDAYNRVSIALERMDKAFDPKTCDWTIIEINTIPEAPPVKWGD